MGLDLHKLEHLVAVAEEGSFTRAARRLHLSQQALSASIRTLERKVGVDLLDRSGNTLTVLPAGEALIADARLLHGAARSALQRARRIGRGERDTLRLGHTPAVTADEVTALLSHVQHADIAVEFNQRYPDELTEQLLAGELDLGLCRAMSPEHGLTRTTLIQHRLRVAIAAEHHLANRSSITLAELADEPIMVWGHPGRSGYTDLLVDHCRRAGFDPDIHRNPIQGTPPVTAVLAAVTSPSSPHHPAPRPAAGSTSSTSTRPPSCRCTPSGRSTAPATPATPSLRQQAASVAGAPPRNVQYVSRRAREAPARGRRSCGATACRRSR